MNALIIVNIGKLIDSVCTWKKKLRHSFRFSDLGRDFDGNLIIVNPFNKCVNSGKSDLDK